VGQYLNRSPRKCRSIRPSVFVARCKDTITSLKPEPSSQLLLPRPLLIRMPMYILQILLEIPHWLYCKFQMFPIKRFFSILRQIPCRFPRVPNLTTVDIQVCQFVQVPRYFIQIYIVGIFFLPLQFKEVLPNLSSCGLV